MRQAEAHGSEPDSASRAAPYLFLGGVDTTSGKRLEGKQENVVNAT